MRSPLYLLFVFFSYIPQSLFSMQRQSHVLPIEQFVTQQDLFATHLINILLYYRSVQKIYKKYPQFLPDYVRCLTRQVAGGQQSMCEIRQAFYATSLMMQKNKDTYFGQNKEWASIEPIFTNFFKILEANTTNIMHAAEIFQSPEYQCIKQIKDMLNLDTQYKMLGDELEKTGELKRFMQHLQQVIADYNAWYAKEIGRYRFLPYTKAVQEKIRLKRQECARNILKNFAKSLHINAPEYQNSFFLCAEKNFHQSPWVLRSAHLKAIAPIVMLCMIICYVLTPAPLWCTR